MAKVSNRTRKKSRHPNWFMFILIAVMLYSICKIVDQQQALNNLDDDLSQAQARYEAAKKENEELLKEQQNLGDPDYVERLAREDLGMTRQGELPYIYSRKE
ncbi:MAG: septum formation initiator family protein [Selenomonadales bacterium]|nr:septum formation initiator family protein [Selenomonadales bacterium]MDD6219319.1 septum formation initiator family protein [Selenomonadaceae bacterium]